MVRRGDRGIDRTWPAGQNVLPCPPLCTSTNLSAHLSVTPVSKKSLPVSYDVECDTGMQLVCSPADYLASVHAAVCQCVGVP